MPEVGVVTVLQDRLMFRIDASLLDESGSANPEKLEA